MARFPTRAGRSASNYETLNAVAVTPKCYALAGVLVDGTTNRDRAWLLSIDAAGGIISDFGYSGSGTGDEQANAVSWLPPAA